MYHVQILITLHYLFLIIQYIAQVCFQYFYLEWNARGDLTKYASGLLLGLQAPHDAFEERLQNNVPIFSL